MAEGGEGRGKPDAQLCQSLLDLYDAADNVFNTILIRVLPCSVLYSQFSCVLLAKLCPVWETHDSPCSWNIRVGGACAAVYHRSDSAVCFNWPNFVCCDFQVKSEQEKLNNLTARITEREVQSDPREPHNLPLLPISFVETEGTVIGCCLWVFGRMNCT